MRTKIHVLKSVQGKKLLGQEVEIRGWLRSFRDQKQFAFLDVNDGSSLAGMQVVMDSSLSNYGALVEDLATGCSLRVVGILEESPGGKQAVEIKASLVEVVGKCSREEYPLQKKGHSLEFLRTIAHLRPRTNTIGAVARIRNALSFATHLFFQEKGFLYLQSPIITASDCEGAGELFQVTTLPLNKMPLKEGKVDFSEDFFGKAAFLTVSGQLNGESYACALSDVYTFGPTFRAENSNTSRHLAEFWMIEPEMAFCDLKGDMRIAEEYIQYVVRSILEACGEDLAFFDQRFEKGLINRLENVIKEPFEHVSYSLAIRILEKAKKKFEYPVSWGIDLQAEHERYLAEEHFGKPIILTDYPKDIKAFYMRDNDDGKTVAAMDILVPKIGEIVGGSQREERYDRLVEKMRAHGLNPEDYGWYLDLRKYGSVPHAGFGVGFERLVQFVTGIDNIRDAIPFPRYPGKAEF